MNLRWRNRFRMFDQLCIFLLVVGTYTAFATTHARDGWFGIMMAVMWVIALAGCFTRVRSKDQSLSFVWFLPLGWVPVFAVGRMMQTTGLEGTALAVAGGLAYTCGVWFLVNDHKHPLYHAVWHCFTIIGSALHFAFVYECVAIAPIG